MDAVTDILALEGADASREDIVAAHLDANCTIIVKLSEPRPLSALQGCVVVDRSTAAVFPIIEVADARGDGGVGIWSDLLVLTLVASPDVTHLLQVVVPGYQPHAVLPRRVLEGEGYRYAGDDLGVTYGRAESRFRLWAPTASAVRLLLYGGVEDVVPADTAPLERDEGGTWRLRLPGDHAGRYYLYEVSVHGETRTAVDPYARAVAPNGTRGLVVDLAATDPAGWADDRHITPAHPSDAVIYEVHVRDFSIDPASGMAYRGQYLAFAGRGSVGPAGIPTGVDHLVALGVTHVQLLPVAAYATVDEAHPLARYNWGYDPRNYNTLTGAYATTPTGTARIVELKCLVQALHAAGIGVILDVVYNHTFAVGDSDFDKIAPGYYYRTDAEGRYSNGSGCGNELASERPMVLKFIVDSLRHWAEEYHVDGFRFDLMALLGVGAMRAIGEDLRALLPGILLYGEPWAPGPSPLSGPDLLWKGCQRGLGVGVFNDDLRNALVGSPFRMGERGFAVGGADRAGAIVTATKGSIDTFAAAPGETINYATSHDNRTLWDRIAASNGDDAEADRILMAELAQAVVLTSQGVPFLQGGEEFLRTKGGDDDSYDAGDAINRFDWARAACHRDVITYSAGLIALRRAHPAFRMSTAADVRRHLRVRGSPAGTVVFALAEHANGDAWVEIVVVYNTRRGAVPIYLSPGMWTIVAWQGCAGIDALGQATGMIEVPGLTCAILHR